MVYKAKVIGGWFWDVVLSVDNPRRDTIEHVLMSIWILLWSFVCSLFDFKSALLCHDIRCRVYRFPKSRVSFKCQDTKKLPCLQKGEDKRSEWSECEDGNSDIKDRPLPLSIPSAHLSSSRKIEKWQLFCRCSIIYTVKISERITNCFRMHTIECWACKGTVLVSVQCI